MILTQPFFLRPAPTVAPELLGKFLVRRFEDGRTRSLLITETEAYDGPDDRASHASRGRTARNEVMFGPAGVWYTYLVYGIHHMLNVVTGPEGYPAAVLLRSLRGVSGPGRLTREFGIDRSFNMLVARRSSGLWVEDRGVIIPRSKIVKAPRVGVDYAGPLWSAKPWRFILDSDYATSIF
ncbi:MAG: DNA-3-methyladenine glycosylase [bacterium]|nr:DNA-3-methyladenine glycosylase [bacterium]